MTKLEKFLDLLVDIVNDDNIPWKDKKTNIIALTKSDEAANIALEEFVFWFAEEDFK